MTTILVIRIPCLTGGRQPVEESGIARRETGQRECITPSSQKDSRLLCFPCLQRHLCLKRCRSSSSDHSRRPGVPGLSCSHASRSDPSGLCWVETFWNSFGCGLRPQCLSQFQPFIPTESRWVPAPSDNVRSEPWHTSPMEFDSAYTKK